jgi:sec-independent protein translocase protein TatB
VFDISLPKALVLAVLALVIFGPDQLPKVAAQAGQLLRQLRNMATGARQDLRDGLGPEFADFDFNDLNPRRFVQKHLLDDLEEEYQKPAYEEATVPPLGYGERPPFDSEAT